MRASAISLCLPLLVSGCAFAFTKGPPAGHDQMAGFECSASKKPAILDVLWAVLLVNGAFAPRDDTTASAPVAVNFTWAGLSLLSSYYGFRRANECSRAKQQLALRLALAPADSARRADSGAARAQPPVSQAGHPVPIAKPPRRFRFHVALGGEANAYSADNRAVIEEVEALPNQSRTVPTNAEFGVFRMVRGRQTMIGVVLATSFDRWTAPYSRQSSGFYQGDPQTLRGERSLEMFSGQGSLSVQHAFGESLSRGFFTRADIGIVSTTWGSFIDATGPEYTTQECFPQLGRCNPPVTQRDSENGGVQASGDALLLLGGLGYRIPIGRLSLSVAVNGSYRASPAEFRYTYEVSPGDDVRFGGATSTLSIGVGLLW